MSLSPEMNLSSEQVQEVLACVHAVISNAEVFIFGSRTKGSAQKSSDLDLLVDAKRPLTDLELSALKESFSLSDLPFFVDLQDHSRVNPEFMEWIRADLVRL